MTRPFRIRSLDGGGIMGAFPASVLATFERATRLRVVDHFDLITGTSTGGIIAIGLAMEASADDICEFYRNEGSAIFPKRTGVRKYLGRFSTTSYNRGRSCPGSSLGLGAAEPVLETC